MFIEMYSNVSLNPVQLLGVISSKYTKYTMEINRKFSIKLTSMSGKSLLTITGGLIFSLSLSSLLFLCISLLSLLLLPSLLSLFSLSFCHCRGFRFIFQERMANLSFDPKYSIKNNNNFSKFRAENKTQKFQ